MDQKFTFTITKDEYLQYLRHQACGMKNYRGYKFWIRTSIPALLICTTLFFRLYQYIWWDVLMSLLILLWIIVGAGLIWSVFLKHRIQEKTLEALHIKGFQEVTMHFLSDRVQYSDQELHEIAYRDIQSCLLMKKMFVFLYQDNKALLLPYRVFKNEAEMKSFLYDFDKEWIEMKKGVEAS